MTRKLAILNEFSEAERILSKGFKNGISYNEIFLLAKYYKFLKLKPKQIRQNIIDFCIQQDEFFNLDTYSKMISSAIAKSKIYKIKSVEGVNIPIYAEEINKIKHLPHKLYKVLFVMLSLARYQKYQMSKIKEINRKKYTYYLNNIEFSDILRMAGYSSGNISQKVVNEIKYTLDGKGGFISANLFSATSWEIKFARNEGAVLALVCDLEHILDYTPYFCLDCGEQFEKSRKRERCPDCHKKHIQEIKKNYMKQLRESSVE